jgi:uncharacterized protein YdaU (DUF1376 family)
MSLPYIPFYIGDHLRDTMRLTTEEHGAYCFLIFEYWCQGSLPDDDVQLARIARVSPKKWKELKPILQAFFHNGWHHKRVDAELEKANGKIEQRRAAADARWEKEGKSRLKVVNS